MMLLQSHGSGSLRPRQAPERLLTSLRQEAPAKGGIFQRGHMVQDSGSSVRMKSEYMAHVSTLSNQSPSSGSCDEAAERWFDRSNENPGCHSLMDTDDPPFFLHPQSPTSTSPAASDTGMQMPLQDHGKQFQIRPAALRRTPASGSSVDDFRSVIDDLTVQNKKLKEKLRKYEHSFGSNLENDRLFEVRIHGLPPRKKRELEETLKAFASSIDGYADTSESQKRSRSIMHTYTSLVNPYEENSSSSTSNSIPRDSAYHSTSKSGPTSTSTVNNFGLEKVGAIPAKMKDQKIRLYLHDIPQGLFPNNPPLMTERAKKRWVVRRLERLFTGKKHLTIGNYSHTRQQQAVSRSAAHTDRQATERQGRQAFGEGVREAHILTTEMDIDKLNTLPLSRGLSNNTSSAARQDSSSCGNIPGSPEQRPTRPVDLDPDRPQIPTENIDYIRHLGLSTPNMTREDSSDVSASAEGWMWLNLLINMAQLHIINVTPAFVRSAIEEVSTKFQLSRDGRKIRWRGGTEGTKLSSDSGADSGFLGSPNDEDILEEDRRKRRKIEGHRHEPSRDGRFLPIPLKPSSSHARQGKATEQWNAFKYQPIFKHRGSSLGDSMSLDGTASESSAPLVTSATGTQSNSQKQTLERSRLSQRGTMIFYGGAPFYTDLSGDRGDTSTPLHVTEMDKDGYSSHTHDAVGCASGEDLRQILFRSQSGSQIEFKPFKDYSICAEVLDSRGVRSWTPELVAEDDTVDFVFSPKWSTAERNMDIPPLELEASGLGGTQPADHFYMTIETRRTKLSGDTPAKLSRSSSPGAKTTRILRKISEASLSSFRLGDEVGRAERTTASLTGLRPGSPARFPRRQPLTDFVVKTEVISSTVRKLWPSMLPPPAAYLGAISSSSEQWSVSSADGGVARVAQRHPGVSFVAEPLSRSLAHGLDLDASTDYSDGSDAEYDDDESIDMLAHAREIDPETVAAREREFDRDEAMHNGSVGATADFASGISSYVSSDESEM